MNLTTAINSKHAMRLRLYPLVFLVTFPLKAYAPAHESTHMHFAPQRKEHPRERTYASVKKTNNLIENRSHHSHQKNLPLTTSHAIIDQHVAQFNHQTPYHLIKTNTDELRAVISSLCQQYDDINYVLKHTLLSECESTQLYQKLSAIKSYLSAYEQCIQHNHALLTKVETTLKTQINTYAKNIQNKDAAHLAAEQKTLTLTIKKCDHALQQTERSYKADKQNLQFWHEEKQRYTSGIKGLISHAWRSKKIDLAHEKCKELHEAIQTERTQLNHLYSQRLIAQEKIRIIDAQTTAHRADAATARNQLQHIDRPLTTSESTISQAFEQTIKAPLPSEREIHLTTDGAAFIYRHTRDANACEIRTQTGTVADFAIADQSYHRIARLESIERSKGWHVEGAPELFLDWTSAALEYSETAIQEATLSGNLMHAVSCTQIADMCADYAEHYAQKTHLTPATNLLTTHHQERAHILTASAHLAAERYSEHHQLSSAACTLVNEYADNPITIAELSSCTGTYVQHHAHEECASALNQLADTRQNTLLNTIDTLTLNCAVNGMCAAQAGMVVEAYTLADICWAALDCIEAIGQGVLQGGYATGHTFRHPIQTVTNTAKSIGTLGCYIAKALCTLSDLSITAYQNPEKAATQWHTYCANAKKLYTTIKAHLSEMKLRDAIRGTATITTETILTGKCLHTFHQFAKKSLVTATELAEKMRKEGKVALTAEGISVRVADKACTTLAKTKKDAKGAIQAAGTSTTACGSMEVFEKNSKRLVRDVKVDKTKGIIKTFEVEEETFYHIFSKKHMDEGILNLGKNKPAILDTFIDIVLEANYKGLLQENSNQIEKMINGHKAIIRVHIQNKGVLSINGFIGSTNRIVKNKIIF